MASRHWKFVGGTKTPRTSLNAAVAAIQKEHAGETAIFNSKTGELYDLTGNRYPRVLPHQYEKMVQVMGLIVLHSRLNIPIPAKNLLPIVGGIGGEVAQDIVKQVAATANQLKGLMEAADNGDSGSVESSNS